MALPKTFKQHRLDGGVAIAGREKFAGVIGLMLFVVSCDIKLDDMDFYAALSEFVEAGSNLVDRRKLAGKVPLHTHAVDRHAVGFELIDELQVVAGANRLGRRIREDLEIVEEKLGGWVRLTGQPHPVLHGRVAAYEIEDVALFVRLVNHISASITPALRRAVC